MLAFVRTIAPSLEKIFSPLKVGGPPHAFPPGAGRSSFNKPVASEIVSIGNNLVVPP